MRPEDRERIQVEVTNRVVDRWMDQGRAAEGALEMLVNDTLFHERRRLEKEPRGDRRTRADIAFYNQIQRRMQHASSRDLRVLLDEMARRFAAEIVGNFDDRVYKFATGIVPTGLGLLLNATSPSRLLAGKFGSGLADTILLRGELDHLRALIKRGTVVVVPTHSSNLDSIIMGYAVYLIGLPPLLYGAGLNLFTNPMISFFMRNLGAYRVDRKKMAPLYKEVLKEYATCALEMGYHNLFFPGGTRSRSGAIETRLKKGLLGTVVRAYAGNLQAKKERPDIFIVPVTLSYKLVLEAETLIDDHLKEVGKSRYIIVDDEFSKPRRILNFMSHLLSLDAKIAFDVGTPIDPFGNRADSEGVSRDPHGRPVDTRRYVFRAGEPVFDDQRDQEYTNETARAIVDEFLRCNVLMSTHVVARAVFNLLRRNNPELDLYRLLRTGGSAPSFTMTDVHLETERVIQAIRGMDDGPQLGEDLAQEDAHVIVADALKHFAIYHTRPAARRRGDRVFHEDRNLLLYYSNRLNGYDLERRLAVRAA